ncbi:zinc finger protein 638 [Trichomycterus rosablanca]|uniref:zinc finger protein 638 n=1 Tax=Trichomycterus rosablanca TaxID=2290929 RepID=UPI002F35A20D
MPRGKETSEDIRKKVVTAYQSGESYKTISKRFQLHPSTVKQIIYKWRALGITATLPKSGQPSKLPPRSTRKILIQVKANPHITSRELQTSLAASGINVHASTIRRKINRHGIHGRVARRKPLLSRKNKVARLNFAREHLDKPEAFWKSILWTDESKIELFGHNHRCHVWRKVNTAYKENNLLPTVKHGGGNNLLPSVRELKLGQKWIMQQHNDPKHSSKTTKEWLKRKKIRTLDWPSQSPDLNPIEMLWQDLKRAVHARCPSNLSQLAEFCMEEWAKIPKIRCETLVCDYRRRLVEVMAAKRSFALFLESCVPPVTNPLSSLGCLSVLGLASLQLAQIKAHLALHQLNVIATRNFTSPLTAVPTPTLLNLLKVTMSHPMYNSSGGQYPSGQRSVVTGQYVLGSQTGLDLAGARLGSGSMSGSRDGRMVNQQMAFPLGQRQPQVSRELDATIDMNIRGAREEVRMLNEMSSKAFSSLNVGHSSSSQRFQSSGLSSISGRSGLDSQPSSEYQPTRYTPESANSILAKFGLSSDDLELLSHYPDDQLTPDNLPFILRDIRMRKAKRNVSDSETQQSKVIDYGHSSKFGLPEEKKSYEQDRHKESRKFGMEVQGASFSKTDKNARPQQTPAAPVRAQPPVVPGRAQLPDVSGRDQLPAAPVRVQAPVVVPKLQQSTSVAPRPTSQLLDIESAMAVLGRLPATPPVQTPAARPSPFPSFTVTSLLPMVTGYDFSSPAGAAAAAAKKLPTPTMMNDYSAATPRLFPHTCSLCNIECNQIKDWIAHQNTSRHIESCRRLRKQYPDWKPDTVPDSRTETKLEHRSPKRRTRSHSYSRSPSPKRHHGSSSRRHQSRSRSPRRYHRHSRSRSHSRSPHKKYGSPSYRRWSRSPPRHRSRSPGYSSSRRSPVRSSRKPSPRRSSPSRPPRSSSSERLVKKLLESSELSSVSDSGSLKAMVQSLAPALLAELAKKRSISSSFSSGKNSSSKKKSSSPSSKRSESSKSSTSSATKTSSTKVAKPRTPTGPGTSCLLRLKNIPYETHHDDLVKAIKPFGSIHTLILLRKIKQASVCMEREEDAQALLKCKDLKLAGSLIEICMEKDASKEQQKKIAPKKKETQPATEKQMGKPSQTAKAREVRKVSQTPKAKEVAKSSRTAEANEMTKNVLQDKGKGAVKANPATKVPRETPVKKIVKKEIPWRKNIVEITGLPETGVTEDDLKNLASPYGFVLTPVIAVTQQKAYLEMPNTEAAEALVKAYAETSAKLHDKEIKIKMMTKPVDLKYTESLFRALMGLDKLTFQEKASLPDRLLTVSNIPKTKEAITEVQNLVKRFGFFKQCLPLSGKIIFEMDSASIAKSVCSRFLKFPCIIQNHSISVKLVRVFKSSSQIKAKSVATGCKPGTKAGVKAQGKAKPNTAQATNAVVVSDTAPTSTSATADADGRKEILKETTKCAENNENKTESKATNEMVTSAVAEQSSAELAITVKESNLRESSNSKIDTSSADTTESETRVEVIQTENITVVETEETKSVNSGLPQVTPEEETFLMDVTEQSQNALVNTTALAEEAGIEVKNISMDTTDYADKLPMDTVKQSETSPIQTAGQAETLLTETTEPPKKLPLETTKQAEKSSVEVVKQSQTSPTETTEHAEKSLMATTEQGEELPADTTEQVVKQSETSKSIETTEQAHNLPVDRTEQVTKQSVTMSMETAGQAENMSEDTTEQVTKQSKTTSMETTEQAENLPEDTTERVTKQSETTSVETIEQAENLPEHTTEQVIEQSDTTSKETTKQAENLPEDTTEQVTETSSIVTTEQAVKLPMETTGQVEMTSPSEEAKQSEEPHIEKAEHAESMTVEQNVIENTKSTDGSVDISSLVETEVLNNVENTITSSVVVETESERVPTENPAPGIEIAENNLEPQDTLDQNEIQSLDEFKLCNPVLTKTTLQSSEQNQQSNKKQSENFDDVPLDFPPVTQEILKALEAAVHQCRLQSSLKRAEEKHGITEVENAAEKVSEKGSSGSKKPITSDKSADKKITSDSRKTQSDKERKSQSSGSRSQHDKNKSPKRESLSRQRDKSSLEEKSLNFMRERSSSSSGSRKSRADSSPTLKRSREREEEDCKSRSTSRSTRSLRGDSKAKKIEEPKEEDFDEPFPFNLDEFVTVDEVVDVEHTPSKCTKSSSSKAKVSQGNSNSSAPKKKPLSRANAKKTRSTPASTPQRTRTSGKAKTESQEVANTVEMELKDSVHQAAVGETVKEDSKESIAEISETTVSIKEAIPDDQLLKHDGPNHVDSSVSAFKDQSQMSEVVEPKSKSAESDTAASELKNTERSLQEALVTLDEVSTEDFTEPGLEELLGCHTGENPEALLTLDEVGDDDYAEAEDEQLKNALQGLVTLDEINADEDEEDEGSFNPDTLLTLDEAEGDEETDEIRENQIKRDGPKAETSAQPDVTGGLCLLDQDACDVDDLPRMKFVTVDEICEEEEDAKETLDEVAPVSKKVGRPKKRTRQTAVRKSVRGKAGKSTNGKQKEESPKTATVKEESSSVTKSATKKQKQCHDVTAVETTDSSMMEVVSSGTKDKKPGVSRLENQLNNKDTAAPERVTKKRASIKEESKLRRHSELNQEPQSKRTCSKPVINEDFSLPPFTPDNPIGVDFVVPKTGFFCKLCSLFYGNEETAKKTHCSSLRHYQNMQKYYEKLKTKTGSSTCTSTQSSTSD